MPSEKCYQYATLKLWSNYMLPLINGLWLLSIFVKPIPTCQITVPRETK